MLDDFKEENKNLSNENEKLKREKEGFFDLKNLQSGEFRKLTPKEVKRVYGLEENK